MNPSPKPVPEVQKLLGVSDRKVLVVEGEDDYPIYAKWLTRLAAPIPYSATLELVKAGGKDPVVRCLRWFADNGGESRVSGLVDRDEWDDVTCADFLAQLPQLRINLSRQAIESYFCDPDELVPAIHAIDPTWDVIPLRATLEAARKDYVRHWALLTTTDRLKHRMNAINYPGQFSATVPIPADDDIQARFRLWAQTIDSVQAFASFDDLRKQALADARSVQYRCRIWAKLFFDRIVHPALNALPVGRPRSGRDWMTDLAEIAPTVPADLEAILRPLL